MKNKQIAAQEIGEGELCPKCGKMMKRFEHGRDWKPKLMQPYHFAFWDRCIACRHVQHYEAAKVCSQ